MVPRSWRKIRYRYDVRGSYCENCGNYHYPPRNFCPTCRRKGKLVETLFPEEGRVVSYTVVREKEPYIIALIELDNGARVLSQLSCEPGEVKIGMRVKKAFRRYGEDGEDGIIHYGTKFVPVD
ncbi:MAG: Zn-ribbon domain-containing OB-fold protein [Archaeoglobus sp.]|uniref:Zn-ribbon domain-containing OB-fold protein n=1 Tax=Archaeoglobus sp. TaxID=1872626 RepID=UPI001DAACB9A|nr:Zn-ribbon domain-containing OB-fold protein [Archaeoglobus sp.]MBO8180042.1 Zn-ribbon domain-containing OB-fold protein [Archaeoglobus sp.]